MDTTHPRTLDDYLGLDYPFEVIADPDGGYVVVFPDLPGCTTQAESVEEVGPMAAEARALWIETEHERGAPIPLPSYPEEHSGKFNVRLPRSLHRSLAAAAKREGVSLNQYVVMLLSRGDAQFRVAEDLAALRAAMDSVSRQVVTTPGYPSGDGAKGRKRPRLGRGA